MKRLVSVMVVLAGLVGVIYGANGNAYTGAKPVMKGATIKTWQTSVTSSTVSAIAPDNGDKVDVQIYNNSSTYTLWIGSSTVAATHGYPIMPKEKWSPNGCFYGTIYAIWDTGAVTATVYTIDLIAQ